MIPVIRYDRERDLEVTSEKWATECADNGGSRTWFFVRVRVIPQCQFAWFLRGADEEEEEEEEAVANEEEEERVTCATASRSPQFAKAGRGRQIQR